MAFFRFRSNRWHARVRRPGQPDETRSFLECFYKQISDGPFK